MLHDLYQAKERFYDIWDSTMTRKQAETAHLDWKDSIPVGILGYFSDLDYGYPFELSAVRLSLFVTASQNLALRSQLQNILLLIDGRFLSANLL